MLASFAVVDEAFQRFTFNCCPCDLDIPATQSNFSLPASV